nr:integrase, catalytic region, zinc finger, CCHC-type, peptidase aspartic, catalytic [Tanacetum cinerariifolium]
MILKSVGNGSLLWPSIKENEVIRPKKYSELSATEAIQADCDVKETNIILQGLPPEERECKLYDELDKFAYKKKESLLNTKFLNTLPPEWSKFVTDVKLVMDLHTMNVDQIHAYLGQNEFHANEKGDDPIDAINHMMSFLTAVVTSRYPPTNNQLGNSSNPRQQATINYGRVTYVNESQQATVQNSNFPTQQDALILSVIEQLKTQVVNCTKINLDNKSVNETLAAELERYKDQSQEKDMVIKKLKERIKSLSGNMKEDKIKQELEEIETINIELDNRVTKLIAKNEHLKQTYKQLYDSIKSLRIRSKEQSLKDNLRKLKGKVMVDEAVILHPIDPKLLKIDVTPLAPTLRNNRTAHYDYLKHTQEETATLREIVKHERSLNPLNTSLDYVCDKLMAVTPMNETKKLNVNSDLQCVTCNGCLFSNNHDSCALEFINTVNARVKSKSVKKTLKRKVWKPTGKVVQIVLWYLNFGCSKHMTGDRSQLTNFVKKFLGTVKFGNDHMAKIMGYGDYQIRNVTISRVYFVEGLGHNLFSIGQFCDLDLEVASRQHTCFIRNLDGVDLLTGSRGNNLYTLSLGDMIASSPICLLFKASKTKSWLWH